MVFPSDFLIVNLVFAVTAVANGIQAWKILEDPTNHTDLILTEVIMPVISGIGLLCKIMRHRTLKNIPVISKYHLIAFLAFYLGTDENVRLALL